MIGPQTAAGQVISPLPEGTTLRPAPDLRSLAGGTVLLGGVPLSVLRLSPAGASTVRGWFRGEEVRPSNAQQELARRLLRRGMVLPSRSQESEGGQSDSLSHLTIVVPVKDDHTGLARTLSSLSAEGSAEATGLLRDGPKLIVVDDGSHHPVSAADLPAGSVLLRNPHPLGPGPARERGLERSTTVLVAFIDAGLDYSLADLQQLVRPFADPDLVAVAPRVRSKPANHLVGRYDHHRSPLDLGTKESLVGPGQAVSYVPSAFLVTRSAAVIRAGGFDPELRYGEDVDLVWRLAAMGDIRYLPMIEVQHDPRASVWAMMQQRACYGSAAAPLAARHGDVVAPARVSPWTLVGISSVFAGRRLVTMGSGAMSIIELRSKLRALPEPTVESTILAGRGHWHGLLSLLNATARTWSPLLILTLPVRSLRHHLAWLAAMTIARRLLDGPRRPIAAVLDLALGVVDDLSYASGVWSGALKQRSLKSIMPTVMSWPDGTKRTLSKVTFPWSDSTIPGD